MHLIQPLVPRGPFGSLRMRNEAMLDSEPCWWIYVKVNEPHQNTFSYGANVPKIFFSKNQWLRTFL